jgi:DNA polymerase-1
MIKTTTSLFMTNNSRAYGGIRRFWSFCYCRPKRINDNIETRISSSLNAIPSRDALRRFQNNPQNSKKNLILSLKPKKLSYDGSSLTQFHYEDDDGDFNPFLLNTDDEEDGDEDQHQNEFEEEHLPQGNNHENMNQTEDDKHSSPSSTTHVSTETKPDESKTKDKLDLQVTGPWAAMVQIEESKQSIDDNSNVIIPSTDIVTHLSNRNEKNYMYNKIHDEVINEFHPFLQVGNRVPIDDNFPSVQTEQRISNTDMRKQNNYYKDDDEESILQQITAIEQYLSATYSNDQHINLNSHKQVAELLYGDQHPSSSTDKDTLEALCASNNEKLANIARRVLQWKQLRKQLKRIQQRKKNNATLLLQQQQRAENNHNNYSISQEDQLEYRTRDDPLILVDASAFIFRAYHAMPPLHRTDGTPVGAVLGVCNMINRLIMDRLVEANVNALPPPRIALVFDSGGPNFRHQLYDKYKANRPPCPIDLVPQFDLVHQAAYAFGIPTLVPTASSTNVAASSSSNVTRPSPLSDAYEADDVIATVTTWAVEKGLAVNLISSDKDLLQLVRDGGGTSANSTGGVSVHMVDPLTMERKTEADVVHKWGVPPSKLGDLLALVGDSTDNVPGIPGIGPKTAASLLKEFDSLECLLSQVNSSSTISKGRKEKINEFKEQAILSRKLVELRVDVPPECILYVMPPKEFASTHDSPRSTETMLTTVLHKDDVVNLRMDPLNKKRLFNFLYSMGFRDLSRRLKNQFNNAAGTAASAVNGSQQLEPLYGRLTSFGEIEGKYRGIISEETSKNEQIPNSNSSIKSANRIEVPDDDEIPF